MSAENPCPMWLYGVACLLGVSEAAESQEGAYPACYGRARTLKCGPASMGFGIPYTQLGN